MWSCASAAPIVTPQIPTYLLLGDQTIALPSQDAGWIPAKVLSQLGLNLTSADRLWWNGQEIQPDQPLPPAAAYTIQLEKARTLTLLDGSDHRALISAGSTPGRVLWDAGLRLVVADRLSVPFNLFMDQPLALALHRSVPINITVKGQQIRTRSAAPSVGQALAVAGVPLEGLDYSIPPEDNPLPGDGNIRVVRVREEILLEQTTLPFKAELVADPELELDQRRVVEAGQYGLQVTRVRLRYEDGKQTARQVEAQWIASQPKNQKNGYGTKVVLRTLEGTGLQYWRAVTVYATSYSPCRSGIAQCSNLTASGKPVQKGVIAVTLPWYRSMAGQSVYIPGYGQAVIADVGGGIPGRYWVDLGYSDGDYMEWHQNVTLYFLAPVPATILWSLP